MARVKDTVTGKVYEGTTDEIKAQIQKEGLWKPEAVNEAIAVENKEPFEFKTEATSYLPPELKPVYDLFRRGDPTKGSEIRPFTPQDEFFNRFGRYVPSLLTAGGGIAGGIGAGPVGSALMSGVGSATGKLFQTLGPQYFGQYRPESVTGNLLGLEEGGTAAKIADVGEDIGIDALFSGLGKAAGAFVPSGLKRRLGLSMPKVFGPTPTIPGKALSQTPLPAEYPDIQHTTGQTNRLARFIEDTFSPKQKENIVAKQEKDIANWFKGQEKNPELVAKAGKALAGSQRNLMTSERTALYNDFRPHVESNIKEVERILPVKNKGPYGFGTAQPVTRKVKIEGPIPLKQSKQFAEDLYKQIRQELGPDDINEANLGAGVGHELKSIMTELDKIRGVRTRIDPTSGIHTDDPIESFYKLKSLKDRLNGFLRSDASDPMKGRLKGSLTALAKTINNDIEAGVKEWSPEAYKSYRKAQDFHAKMAQKFRPKLARKILGAGDLDPETTYMDVAKEALGDPQKMRQFKNATGDKTLAKNLIMNEMAKGAEDAATETFDPGKALKYLADNKQLIKEGLNPVERTQLKRFLHKANRVEPLGWQTFSNSLNMSKGKATIGAGLGLASLGITGDPEKAAYFTGGIILPSLAAKEFSKRILMNPQYAKIAIGAMSASPVSPKGVAAQKLLLGLAKGLQVELMSKDGRKIPTTIDENGKIVIPD